MVLRKITAAVWTILVAILLFTKAGLADMDHKHPEEEDATPTTHERSIKATMEHGGELPGHDGLRASSYVPAS